jgi:hypothetical protein
VLSLLLILRNCWTLIANLIKHPQKSGVLTYLLLVATLGIVLFSGISIDVTKNNNLAQAEAARRGRTDKYQHIMGNTK